MATIADVMTKDVVTLSSDSTVSDAAQVMVRGGFGSVVVVPVSYTHLTLPTILLV